MKDTKALQLQRGGRAMTAPRMTKRDAEIMRRRRLERVALELVWQQFCENNIAHDIQSANTKEQFEAWLLEQETERY